ncbi:hypothetical protein HSBAA_53690 [Vreelandella sulfidaeris]|uniref:HAMP domain-containing protein n=1 Tax=Vreelandella sulfidaeris TaxID=115553 RepID=A0A455UFF7_9GAMM|nr:hypothetical protein HSBAA_53690 [Halomonas sulfidaeris]
MIQRVCIMRRMLSNGSFLRFYLLLGVALLVVFVIALAGRSFIEQVRREDYREQLAALPMSLMTRQLADTPVEQRKVLLDQFAQQLALQLTLQPISEADLGYFERSRLEQGKILVDESPWLLQQRLPGDAWLLQARLDDWESTNGTAALNCWANGSRQCLLMNVKSASPSYARVAGRCNYCRRYLRDSRHSSRYSWPVAASSRSWFLISSLVLLYQLPGESQWLQAGPISRGDTLPPNLHLPLLVGLMIVLSLIIYLIMRSIEARMARLELAATRIASGRLETRVKGRERGFSRPFGHGL